MSTSLSWIQPLLIISTKPPPSLTRITARTIILLGHLLVSTPLSHFLHNTIAKVILLNSKSIMSFLDLKPSNESPFHSEQKAKSWQRSLRPYMSRPPFHLPGLLSSQSPSCSLHIHHIGLLTIPLSHQACSHLRAFALALVPSAGTLFLRY